VSESLKNLLFGGFYGEEFGNEVKSHLVHL